MKDMIDRIIEMDKTARDLTQRVQKDRLSLENEIKVKKEEIRNEYLERARKRLAANEITEKQKQKIISTCKEISESLDKLYAQKCDEWVDIIVKNVVGE